MEDEERGGFLPPEPAGPEPELEGRRAGGEAAASPPPAQGGPQAPAGGYAPPGPGYPPPGQGYPPPGQGYAGQPPPAQGYAPAPPGQAYPPPPGGGWAAPPGQNWQPPPQPWGYPQPPTPDNNSAVAGFVLSLVSIGLLLFSAGLSSIVSVGCSIAAIVLGRKGVRKVDTGETPRHRGLAQAGFWVGVGGLVLSVLATLAWLAFVVVIATDDEARRDFENEFDESQSISAALVGVLRLVAHLVT